MIEEKALAVKWSKQFLEEDQNSFTLSPICYQYILWSDTKEYQTQSFDWLTLNTHLRASLENQSFTEQFIDVMKSIKTFADIIKLIKIEEELRDFQHFTNIVPFKKPVHVRD
ncbi:hypothetical protein [Alkalihalobacterium elongatum]|uniref:hypothetical protein n=1 Tax=Alkalihalobacterium elongatum TaxID=2675466 RepID=UPI001C1F653B|nr:hypothetical protein [Alkalihalobacterium elongatum]